MSKYDYTKKRKLGFSRKLVEEYVKGATVKELAIKYKVTANYVYMLMRFYEKNSE